MAKEGSCQQLAIGFQEKNRRHFCILARSNVGAEYLTTLSRKWEGSEALARYLVLVLRYFVSTDTPAGSPSYQLVDA